jgi:hypothetical protein
MPNLRLIELIFFEIMRFKEMLCRNGGGGGGSGGGPTMLKV